MPSDLARKIAARVRREGRMSVSRFPDVGRRARPVSPLLDDTEADEGPQPPLDIRRTGALLWHGP
jgi:hypothetical protein